LTHPYFTGKRGARLAGEEAAYDVYIACHEGEEDFAAMLKKLLHRNHGRFSVQHQLGFTTT